MAAQRESEAADAKKQLSKAKKQIEKLNAQLETERKKAKSSKNVRTLPPYFMSLHTYT
jgi:predicted  nucleic acid-binding Zn-ribbon protein